MTKSVGAMLARVCAHMCICAYVHARVQGSCWLKSSSTGQQAQRNRESGKVCTRAYVSPGMLPCHGIVTHTHRRVKACARTCACMHTRTHTHTDWRFEVCREASPMPSSVVRHESNARAHARTHEACTRAHVQVHKQAAETAGMAGTATAATVGTSSSAGTAAGGRQSRVLQVGPCTAKCSYTRFMHCCLHGRVSVRRFLRWYQFASQPQLYQSRCVCPCIHVHTHAHTRMPGNRDVRGAQTWRCSKTRQILRGPTSSRHKPHTYACTYTCMHAHTHTRRQDGVKAASATECCKKCNDNHDCKSDARTHARTHASTHARMHALNARSHSMHTHP